MAELTTINPSTEEKIRAYPLHTDAEIHEKLKGLSSAFTIWRLKPPESRTAHIDALCNILHTQRNILARLISIEMGKPIAQAEAEIEKCIHLCQYYQDICADVLVDELLDEHIVSYLPLGVIFGIMPWNYPFWQVFRFMIPTLLSGNVCIIKLADNVSGCAQAIESMMKFAGFPENLVLFIRCTVDQTHQTIKHPIVRGVSFTGSQQVGKEVAQSAASKLKPCILELGGNDGYYIHHDANINQAISSLVNFRFNNAGQSCISPKRIFIHQKVYDKTVQSIIKIAANFTPSSAQDSSCLIGPIARQDLLEKLQRQRQDLVDSGAKILFESQIPEAGYFFPATVMELPPGLNLDEELFGPIICVQKTSGPEEAISQINASHFGLGSGIFMKDEDEAFNLAYHHFDAGMCGINRCVSSHPSLPFGGIKGSGIGRELSINGLTNFCNTKVILRNELD